MEDEKRVSGDTAETSANAKAPEADKVSDGARQAPPADVTADEAALVAAAMQKLVAENEELKDKSLRLVAEMENLRRRTERDKAEFAKYAISEFARDIVGVSDNIRRAIESVPKDALSAHSAFSSLIEGVEVTERELLKVLERYQVTRFDPIGEPFNPHLHDAMTKVELPNVPAETVVQVIHAGFMIGERVLRPAAVIVAKGGGAYEPATTPLTGTGGGSIPLGAMKVPDDAISSLDVAGPRSEPQQTVFGRQLAGEKRRSGLYDEPPHQERVAPFRRAPRPAEPQRPQQSGQMNKPSSLNKPIINSKPE